MALDHGRVIYENGSKFDGEHEYWVYFGIWSSLGDFWSTEVMVLMFAVFGMDFLKRFDGT